MSRRGWTPFIWWALAIAVGAWFYEDVARAWAYGSAANPASASDSLPLYLGANALDRGLDPTDPASLTEVYSTMDGQVTKALFSVLYPPSMHVLLQPLAGLSHHGFLYYWRWVLLGLTLGGLAFAGMTGVSGRRAPLAAVLGAGGGLALFPFFLESQLALGQANLAIGGCFGLAMGLAAWSRWSGVGVVTALGAGAKLVPAIILWPLLWGLRKRAILAAAVVGLGVLGLTMAELSLERIVTNVLDTLAFQRSVEPHWLHEPSLPDWGRFVGRLKRPALTGMSLLLVAWTQWLHRGHHPRGPESLAVGIGLLGVALGADGAGAAAPYATLAMPGAAALLTWPLAERSSRLSWLGCVSAFAVVGLLPGGLEAPIHDTEVRLVAACSILWVGLALRLCMLARPWTRRSASVASLVLIGALIYTAIYTWRPPYEGPKGLPEASPGSMTTPEAPPIAPTPR